MSSLLVKAFIYNNKNNNKLYYSDVYKLPLGLMYKNEKKPPQKTENKIVVPGFIKQ